MSMKNLCLSLLSLDKCWDSSHWTLSRCLHMRKVLEEYENFPPSNFHIINIYYSWIPPATRRPLRRLIRLLICYSEIHQTVAHYRMTRFLYVIYDLRSVYYNCRRSYSLYITIDITKCGESITFTRIEKLYEEFFHLHNVVDTVFRLIVYSTSHSFNSSVHTHALASPDQY